MTTSIQPTNILLVEDNPGDVELTRQNLEDGKIATNLYVVSDGQAALEFLRRQGTYVGAPRPDLILLDLNLPKKDGREVLAEIKSDTELRTIPVIILTTSQSEEDVLRAYGLNANAYVAKPVDADAFARVVRGIEDFWLAVVKLPRR